MSLEWMGDPYAAQLRAAKAEGELARIKDELREFAEDNGLNPEMEPRDLLAKATGAFRSCAAMSDARYTEIRELRAVMEFMRPRLMPEGMEWLRYDTGEPVPLGGKVKVTVHDEDGDFDRTFAIRSIKYKEYGVLLEGTGNEMVILSLGERVKRPQDSAADDDGCCEPGTYRCQEAAFTCDSCGHTVFVDKCMVDEVRYLRAKGIRTLNCCCGHDGKAEPSIIVNEGDECRMLNMGYERHVNEYGATYFTPKSSCPTKVLAADGEPLEVGQTVWDADGDEFRVLDLYGGPVDEDFPDHTVRCRRAGAEDYESTMCAPSDLTHQRPVLDADGVHIREGDTVWHIETGREYVVVEPSYGETAVVRLAKYDDAEGEQYAPDMLTHERPESKCRDCAHWQKDPTADNMGVCWFFYHEHEGQDCYAARRADIGACEEFMPRARALAERERGE